MAFVPGNPGRPKGALGAYRKQARELSEEMGVDPLRILFSMAADTQLSPMVRANCASAAAQYIYPKLKAVEYTHKDILGNMSPEQKLEAMKQGVSALELELKITNTSKRGKKKNEK